MNAFIKELRASQKGEVYSDPLTRGLYSTDASNYQIIPRAVIVPEDEEDVHSAVRIAVRHGVPILPRGAGTSLGGQVVGRALLIDFSRKMNRILHVDVANRRVRVQPGIVRDELNLALAKHGLHFAPDPATGNRANVGGMVGNNSSGTRSILYGKTVDHVVAAKVMLADGEIIEFREWGADEYRRRAGEDSREGEILRQFREIIERGRGEIVRRFPKVMRRVGGYNLDEFVGTDRWNIARLLTGSEGTLAVSLELELNLEPLPAATSLAIPHFRSLEDAIRAVQPILEHGPSAVEILDGVVIRMALKNIHTAPIAGFLDSAAEAVLIVEFFGESEEEAAEKGKKLAADLRARGISDSVALRTDRKGQREVWEVRKSGLGLMLGIPGERKSIPFIEDAAIPLEHLPEYVARVMEICRKVDTDASLYAHASVGVIHIRPILDLRKISDVERMKTIADETFRLVMEYGGAWCGEHGDGLVRSPFMERFYGPEVYRMLVDVKKLFDPHNLMNPGKIVDAEPIDRNLRLRRAGPAREIDSWFHYRKEGSFRSAVERCNGVGVCRKTTEGTLCPSYRVTRREHDSTRGRANAIRLALGERSGLDGLGDDAIMELLATCLSCKACRNECPTNVDMSRLKAEVMQLRRDRHGTPLRDRLAGSTAWLAEQLSGSAAPLVNMVQSSLPFRKAMEKIAGIDSRRALPPYARETFNDWFQRSSPLSKDGKPGKVALFADTYIRFFEPDIGINAVELLESLGYEVLVTEAGCCQRPRISHGLLREAKRDGEETLRRLDSFVQKGIPVVVCEPSCASALVEDLPDLIEDVELGERIAGGVLLIDRFLLSEFRKGRITGPLRSDFQQLLVHGHCHQKALGTGERVSDLYSLVPGLTIEEIDSGCCGMAGSFGYEKENYDLSLAIGEDRLFPAIRNREPGARIVANGFSCRHQIAHATGVRAVHWVETLRGNCGRE